MKWRTEDQSEISLDLGAARRDCVVGAHSRSDVGDIFLFHSSNGACNHKGIVKCVCFDVHGNVRGPLVYASGGTMSLYEGFFGAKKKSAMSNDGPEHFRVRPFAEHMLNDHQASVSIDAGATRQTSTYPNKTQTSSAPVAAPSANQSWVETIASSVNNSTGNGAPVHNAGAAHVVQPDSPPAHPQSLVPPRSQGQHLQSVHAQGIPPQPMAATNLPLGAWNESYDRSLGNIQNHVHAVAGAVAMLDAVEHKMIAIKCELQRIREAGLVIDSDKVLLALQSLSDYVNQAISSVDDQCVNMLRDAKLEIRFAELEDRDDRPDGVKLTMISVERLLDYKIKSALAEGLVAEETPEFVDDICAIVSSNIQVLTSVMLALFASRDYTQAVTKLAARESIIPSVKDESAPQLTSATIDRLQFESIDQRDGQSDQLQEGRASLAELLKGVRENRNGVGAPFN